MSTEVDKKLRKKQSLLFDPKESVGKRVKTCISLAEKNMNQEDFDGFIKQNREGFGSLVNELFQYLSTHTKKGRITVSLKEAQIHLKLIRIMSRHYLLDELKNFDLYKKGFDNYLKIESNPEIREDAFKLLIELIIRYGVDPSLTTEFIKSINIGELYNNQNDFPLNKLEYGETCYCGGDMGINQQEMTKKFLKLFIETIKTPEVLEKLSPLLEAILSYIYPSFADQAQYAYKSEHQIDFEGQNVEVEQFVLEQFKVLYSSPVVEVLKKRASFIIFIKHFFGYVLQLPVNEKSTTVILSTIKYFFDLILFNTLTLEKEEDVLLLQKHIISTTSVLFDVPFSDGDPNTCSKIAEEIKKQIIKLTQIKTEVNGELKKTTKEMVLNCIESLAKQKNQQTIESYVDLLFIVFVSWNFESREWKLLKITLSAYYSNASIMKQIEMKFKHVTRIILKDYYSELLMENTDEVFVGSKKVERSAHLEVPGEVFVAPLLDEKFKELFPNLGKESALELWYHIYSLFEDVNGLSRDDSYENGIMLLYDIACILIKGETKVFQFGSRCDEQKPKLMDLFGKIFFESLEREKQTNKLNELCYRLLCKLVNRSYIRYNNEIYSLFYEKVIKGFENFSVILLEELYDIISNQVPGWPILLPCFINSLKSLKSESLLESNNKNRDIQIVSLLNSLVSVSEIYPTIAQDLANVGKLSLEFEIKDEISKCYDNALEVFGSVPCQVLLIYGVSTHIILSRKRSPSFIIDNLLLIIIEKIESDKENLFRPAAEVIGELATFADYFTVEDTQFLLKKLIEVIINPQVRTEAVACIFTALTEWAFSPSCICFKALTPQLTVDLLNAVSLAMNLKQENRPTDPNIKYRACAPECAEIFIQTLLNTFAFVPSEKGNDKYLSSKNEESGEVTWWAYGNNILSVEQGKDKNFCTIIVRNAVGKTAWSVQSVSVLEDIGIEGKDNIRKLTVKDIIQDAPKEKVEERVIDPRENKLREMINEALKEEEDFLDWGMPEGINKEEYDNDLEVLKAAIQEVNKQVKGFAELKQTQSENKFITEKRNEIDNSKILTQLLLCSTQSIDVIGKSSTLLVPINPTEKFKILLNGLEKSCVRPFHKIGLIYVKNGQNEQTELLKNQEGSPAFKEFAEGLGWTVDLETHNGFLGGLDKTYLTTGKYIRYYADATKEVVFHDITLMPTVADDAQQITKKRHVGNDYVHIVWNESDYYSPYTISSQFNAAHIVITPIGNGLHKIRIWRKPSVRQYGLLTDGMIVGKEILPALVRETAINANHCCSLNISPDDYLKPYLRRTTLIREIIDKNDSFPQTNFFSTLSLVTNPQAISDLSGKK